MMPWIDYRGRSEFRDGGIVKAEVVARPGGGWEAIDLAGKLTGAGQKAVGKALGNFLSLYEGKKAVEGLWNYLEGELPGSD
jgi:hypothetical protein